MKDYQVICPTCGHTGMRGQRCRVCGETIVLDENDYQAAVFVGMDDGYHSWYSQPTSVHERYRCARYGAACEQCVHAARSDIFCYEGRIDVRRMRRVQGDGTVVYEYKDWIEKG